MPKSNIVARNNFSSFMEKVGEYATLYGIHTVGVVALQRTSNGLGEGDLISTATIPAGDAAHTGLVLTTGAMNCAAAHMGTQATETREKVDDLIELVEQSSKLQKGKKAAASEDAEDAEGGEIASIKNVLRNMFGPDADIEVRQL